MITPMLVLSLAACARAGEWLKALPDAVAQSKQRAQPILLDFQAPWCYSCYYMEQRVLSRERFQKAAQGLVPVKLDVDTAEGSGLKAKYAVTFLPTYVLLAPGGGREVGRIIGEQTEADFMDKLGALTGGKKTEDAEREALRQRIGKGDVAALREALNTPDCQTPYYVEKGNSLLPTLFTKPKEKRALLDAERQALEKLAEARLFVPADQRCADFRSGIEALAETYEQAGEPATRDQVLDRAIAQLERDQSAVGEDRNRDDNLRLFLDMRGAEDKLRAHYDALIRAYPSDYVYPYRWAKHLSEKGKAAEALPWIEKADRLAYGANRLDVTNVRAKILAALGRKAEGVALLKRDLDASKGRFGGRGDALKKTLAELSK